MQCIALYVCNVCNALYVCSKPLERIEEVTMGKGGREVPRDNVKGNTIPSQVLNDDDDDDNDDDDLVWSLTSWEQHQLVHYQNIFV